MKKPGLLTTILMAITIQAFSQDFRIGLDTDFSSKNVRRTEDIPSQEFESSFTRGLTAKVFYQFNDRLNIQSGIGYELNTFKLNYNYDFTDPNDPLIPEQSISRLTYLNIPLHLGYSLSISDRIILNPSVGMNFGLLINDTEELIFEANNSVDSGIIFQKLNNVIYSANFALPVHYVLTEKTSITFNPFVTKALNKIDETYSDNTFSQYGARLGILVKI